MKLMMFVTMVLTFFLAADAAYALGGGGGHGDGRMLFLQNGGTGGGAAVNAPAQNGQNGSTQGTAGDAGSPATNKGSTTHIMSLNDPVGLNSDPVSLAVVAVPEPLGLCLLGLGVVGLAGVRRKLQK